jgi:hypothetical protein
MFAAPLSGMARAGDESNDCATRTTVAVAKTIADLRIASFPFFISGGWSLFALVGRRNDCLRTFLRLGKIDR